MYKWSLSKYSLFNDEEEIVFEHNDPDVVAAKAIELSNEGQEVCGIWTYRMEAWVEGKRAYGFRFFNNGKEFTKSILDSVKNT